jgi:membrane protein implicated in regulation of membrane protease activity
MSATFVRYALFQSPGALVVMLVLVGAVKSDLLELKTAAGALLLWIAKDLALYPILKRAYDPVDETYTSRLVGREGRARQDLEPRGYVTIGGELWRAEAEDGAIRAGEVVTVVAAAGARLVVRRSQGAETGRST